ncbi:MAG: MFS transporter [Pyrinomonadaceae bacterium]
MDDSTAPAPSGSIAAAAANVIPRYSYYALGVLTFVNFLNYIDRQVLPALGPTLKKELGFTDTEFGMMEAALLLSFTILAPLFGKLGDKGSRTKLMAVAAVIWSIATAVTGLSDKLPFMPGALNLHLPIVNFTLALSGIAILFCLVRAIVGVGESSFSTITPSLIADYFPPAKRATALGIFQAAIPMGFALGYVIGAVLAYYFGWRLAFMFVGIPGLITAVFVWKLKEPIRGATDALDPLVDAKKSRTDLDAESGVQTSWLRTASHIVMTRDWLLSTMGYTALTFALGAFATWGTILLTEDKGMTQTSAAVALGLVTLLGGAAGTFGGGWLADRVAKKRVSVYFYFCAAGSILGVIPALVVLSSNRAVIFLPAIFLAVMFLFVNNAPFHAILVGSVSPLVRATAVALNIVFIHVFGDVQSRFGVGILSDAIKDGKFAFFGSVARMIGLDPTAKHLSAALLVAPIALVVSSALFLWGARSHKPPTANTH